MPTYQYRCTECGGQLEAVQKFTDDPLTVHDECGGRLRKVFSPVGIVFKGSGFYRTDSRKGSTASEPASSAAASGSSADSSSLLLERRQVRERREVGERRQVLVLVLVRRQERCLVRLVVFIVLEVLEVLGEKVA